MGKDVVLAAVSQNGMALQYASEDLRADPEVVLAAIAQNGNAMMYAARHFQADRDFVRTAVGQQGGGLEQLEHIRPGTALHHVSRSLHTGTASGSYLDEEV